MISINASAYTCVYQKDKTVINIRHMEDRNPQWHCSEKLKARLDLPLEIDINSPGGWLVSIHATLHEIWQLAFASAYYSHTRPLVHVHGNCASACIGLLAGLNQLARDKAIVLAVDPDTKLGFHAASYLGSPDPMVNMIYLLMLSENGVNLQWIRANESNLFSSLEAKQFTPNDPLFENSNILNFATIANARQIAGQFPAIMAKADNNN